VRTLAAGAAPQSDLDQQAHPAERGPVWSASPTRWEANTSRSSASDCPSPVQVPSKTLGQGQVTRLLVALAVRLYRDGLEFLLADDPTIDVVGKAATWEECQWELDRLAPDVTLLDWEIVPGDRQLSALVAAKPKSLFLGFVVGQACDVVRFAEAGVAGYLTKDDSLDDLRVRIVNVRHGQQPCTPEVAGLLLRRVARLAKQQPVQSAPPTSLTSRERQMLVLLGDGLSNKEIAARLHLQMATVKNHIHHVLAKMQVRSRAEAAARYRQHLGSW